jgi:hypothetical protein
MRTWVLATSLILGCLWPTTSGLLADPAPSSGAKPEASEKSETAAPQTVVLDTKKLAELALEHSRARDALLAIEARLALLAEKVFDSRLTVRYEGELDKPFIVTRIELDLDGALAYRNEFSQAPTVQSIKLFDGYLPPGRHVLQMRVYARGPDDPPNAEPGYFAGSGMTVHLRNKSVCRAVFEAEQDGDSPGSRVAKESEPEGDWDVDIAASFETETN